MLTFGLTILNPLSEDLRQIRPIRFGGDEFAVWRTVREVMLRRPLGLSLSDQEIAAEADQFHLCLFVDESDCTLYDTRSYRVQSGEILAGGLILVRQSDESIFKMRQVAVLPDFQGRGFGSTLVRYGEKFARQNGGSQMVLHARDATVGFYEKLDYQRVGEPFQEVGITHFKMQKGLPTDS